MHVTYKGLLEAFTLSVSKCDGRTQVSNGTGSAILSAEEDHRRLLCWRLVAKRALLNSCDLRSFAAK
jgi:hypothetical protein